MKKSMYRWRFFLAAVVILAGAGIWIIQKKSGTFVPATEVSLKGPYGTLTLQLPEEWTYEIQTENRILCMESAFIGVKIKKIKFW